MTRPMILTAVVLLGALVLLGIACAPSPSAQAEDHASIKPTLAAVELPSRTVASFARPLAAPPRDLTANCFYPAGWQVYTVGEKETAQSVAWQFNLTVEQLLQGNCIPDPVLVVQGLVIYVPPIQPNLQTVLPLGVSAFIAQPALVSPGGKTTLAWQSQGDVRSVRVGWVFNGQYYQSADQLPANGSLEVFTPNDGRDLITYVVIVSNGQQEVYAQTTVQIECREGWFFAPSPLGCPSALLVTQFQEQAFERGTILYLPALGRLYVMVVGQEAIEVDDTYIPGQPNYNPAIAIPSGYSTPTGALYHLWQNEAIRTALGFALQEPITYDGMLQRAVSLNGEVLYLLASSGHVYRIGRGLVWGVIIPQ